MNYPLIKKVFILSDDAPQFNIFQHFLCWVHALRSINTLIPKNEQERIEFDRTWEMVRDFYWIPAFTGMTPGRQIFCCLEFNHNLLSTYRF